jgi:hypothetical protein
MIRRLVTLLTAGLLATTSACAARTAAVPATAPSASAPGSAPGSPPCAAHVVAGDPANNTTVCVTLGSDLTVLLRAPAAGSTWSTPEVTGGALGRPQPVPSPAGSVGWQFQAVARGTADLTTSRDICPSGPPGALRCRGLIAYRLHVEVR